jgi:FixJ family two-component response regulator
VAMERSREMMERNGALRALRDRYGSLTPRERDFMALVVSGLLNKQVGGELGISEITVKAHRGQVMRKMIADSLPGLVRMAAHLDSLNHDDHQGSLCRLRMRAATKVVESEPQRPPSHNR